MLGDHDEAQDLAQDTFIRLWRSGPPVADARQVTSWVYRTATRLAIDSLRARAVRDAVPAPDVVDEGPFSLVAARREIEVLARSTPRDELEAALLDRLDGLTHAETAEVMGVSERTVRRLLKRFDARAASVNSKRHEGP
jgi:RNA polymerase sigma-70 factor (ECF subfamily)